MADAHEERPESESPDAGPTDSQGPDANASRSRDEAEENAEPEEGAEPDPSACRGEAVSMAAFIDGVESGEWLDKGYLFYIEPEGILHGPLLCCRSDGEVPAGLVMTRQAWRRGVVFLDDGRNPDRYELSRPKEVGYVKSIHHYMESSREHARYPWTKKY